MELALTNVIDISVSEAQAGAGEYNTSNLGLFTDEVPGVGFGSLGYKIYLSPSDVATDFGSTSKTYKMANLIFGQKPNLLAGSGYLVIIPMTNQVQHIAFSGTAASGQFVLNYGGHATAAILYTDTAAQIQTKLQAVLGLEEVTVTGSIATTLNVQMSGVYGNPNVMTVTGDTLQTGGSVAITLTITKGTAGETIDAAITRTENLVQYFGILATETCDAIGQTDLLAAAAVILALNKIGFFVSNTEADIQSGGMIDRLRTGSFHNTRGLYYGGTAEDARGMSAAYAGRALSVNFTGSNTTITMHLKDLLGVDPDPAMTQTILTEALVAGADTYVSLQGVPKVFCSGANQFYDQVYNLQWFVGALQIAGFNFLAEASTKIPQTENGMSGLKNAYRQVCEQAVTNQYCAPGSWNSGETFGNQADFLANITQRGYYIYSTPVALQSQADRADRVAPLVSIALKEAGAIHSSTVIVNVNA